MEMKLHMDRDAFQALLTAISEKTGVREDILEKDYYLTLLQVGSSSLPGSSISYSAFECPV